MILKRTTIPIILVVICFFSSTNLKVKSSQATVPINITVEGKLIITDGQNDNKSGVDPTLNVILKLIPDLNNSIVNGSSKIRIRTNLNNWKLTAQRNNTESTNNIDPEDISLSFTTQAGSTANSNAAKLISPFDITTNLSQISTTTSSDILIGNSRTSIQKDPENKNNWFQLTSNYSISPDFFYEVGDWNTIVSYNLVSP